MACSKIVVYFIKRSGGEISSTVTGKRRLAVLEFSKQEPKKIDVLIASERTKNI